MGFIAAALPAIFSATTATGAAAAGTAAAAASVPAWVAYAGLGASLLGGGIAAYGAIKQGEAQADAAEYNAKVQEQNAQLAKRNAEIAGQSGEANAAIEQQKTRALVGEIRSNQAASGINVDTGSAVDVRSSAAELGQLNALSVRTQAVREAYGYTQQAASAESESKLNKYEAGEDRTAGWLTGAGTALGTLSSTGTKYYEWKKAGSL